MLVRFALLPFAVNAGEDLGSECNFDLSSFLFTCFHSMLLRQCIIWIIWSQLFLQSLSKEHQHRVNVVNFPLIKEDIHLVLKWIEAQGVRTNVFDLILECRLEDLREKFSQAPILCQRVNLQLIKFPINQIIFQWFNSQQALDQRSSHIVHSSIYDWKYAIIIIFLLGLLSNLLIDQLSKWCLLGMTLLRNKHTQIHMFNRLGWNVILQIFSFNFDSLLQTLRHLYTFLLVFLFQQIQLILLHL